MVPMNEGRQYYKYSSHCLCKGKKSKFLPRNFKVALEQQSTYDSCDTETYGSSCPDIIDRIHTF